MSSTHPYVIEKAGRSCKAVPPHGHQMCQLACRCGSKQQIRFRQLCGSDQIDQKFTKLGWKLDPARCPACLVQKKDDRKMATQPTPNAIKAQALMFNLLTAHFNAEDGAYSSGWSDAKVAHDTGMAADRPPSPKRSMP